MSSRRDECGVWQGLFDALPFIVGGMEYSCVGADGSVAPFYLKALSATSDRVNKQVQLSVRPAHISDIISGRAHIERPVDGGNRRSTLPSGTSTQKVFLLVWCFELWADVTHLSVDQVLPPTGCVYNHDGCKSVDPLTMLSNPPKSMFGSSGIKSDLCPSGYPNINMFSLSQVWDNGAAYNDPNSQTVEQSVCIGGACTCEGISAVPCIPYVTRRRAEAPAFRFHCCDSTYAEKLDFGFEATYEFNMNYNKSTGEAAETKKFGNNDEVDLEAYAFLELKLVMDLELSSTKYSSVLGGVNVPNGLNKLDAYIEGTAKLQVAITSDSLSTTVGPAALMDKSTASDAQYQMGFLPVKVSNQFSLHATLEVEDMALTSSLGFKLKAEGSIKVGGKYDGTTTPASYNSYQDTGFEYSDEAPTTTDATLNGNVKLTLTPTVYYTVYDLIPLEFPVNLYAGVNFTETPAYRFTGNSSGIRS